MAGETINERGSFVNIQVAASTAAAAFSAGARTTIAAALTAGQESNYPLLDLQVDVSTGTIVADDVLHVYRRNKADGTNETPVPDATFKSQYMGTFLLDVGGQYFYIFGLPNDDPSATFYVENAATNTLTVALAARARTYKAAS